MFQVYKWKHAALGEGLSPITFGWGMKDYLLFPVVSNTPQIPPILSDIMNKSQQSAKGNTIIIVIKNATA